MLFNRSLELTKLTVLKLSVLCFVASLMDIFLPVFFRNFLGLPLYIDTVFAAAIAFAFGLIPGIAVAVLSWVILCTYWGVGFHLYVLCSIAEVLLICALKPAAPEIPKFAPKEKVIASYTGLAARLMLLYILCAAAVSILGGLINYVSDLILNLPLHHSSVEDTFKLALIMSNLPALAVNILSRIPINIVDRFIVIFGGYFISRGLLRLFGGLTPPSSSLAR
ncbi:MAG: hypothetical protein FWH19_05350 [Treponema sp.]|nr:hypothetical protein [Treponema sp.]